jgi:hypothetical protein
MNCSRFFLDLSIFESAPESTSESIPPLECFQRNGYEQFERRRSDM